MTSMTALGRAEPVDLDTNRLVCEMVVRVVSVSKFVCNVINANSYNLEECLNGTSNVRGNIDW